VKKGKMMLNIQINVKLMLILICLSVSACTDRSENEGFVNKGTSAEGALKPKTDDGMVEAEVLSSEKQISKDINRIDMNRKDSGSFKIKSFLSNIGCLGIKVSKVT
jgi:hypothetical protein